MLDLSNLSENDLLTKISQLNEKLNLTSSISIASQLQSFLNELYQEYDERMMKQNLDETSGVHIDTEEAYQEIEKGQSKDSKKVKEKAKNFLDKMPEIKMKWNDSNPRAIDEQNKI